MSGNRLRLPCSAEDAAYATPEEALEILRKLVAVQVDPDALSPESAAILLLAKAHVALHDAILEGLGK